MTINEYKEKAMSTCMPTCENFSYMMLNLVGEVGELASKVAKSIRKGYTVIGKELPGNIDIPSDSDLHYLPKLDASVNVAEWETELKQELGDIMWQVMGICEVMCWEAEEVAQMNLDKLSSRAKRGKIDGNGDNR